MELGELAVGEQKPFLQRVLAVLLIAEHETGSAPEFRQARGEEIIQLDGGHIDGQNLLVVRFVDYAET